MPILEVKSDFTIEKAPEGLETFEGAAYLKDSPIDVNDREAELLLQHYPKVFSRMGAMRELRFRTEQRVRSEVRAELRPGFNDKLEAEVAKRMKREMEDDDA